MKLGMALEWDWYDLLYLKFISSKPDLPHNSSLVYDTKPAPIGLGWGLVEFKA